MLDARGIFQSVAICNSILWGIMARINFEEDLFKDKRFEKLLLKTGSKALAIGYLVEAWFLAQKFHLQGHGIPKPVWIQQDMSPLIIEVGLAEDRGDFIYVKGSKEHFQWLIDYSNQGRKGAMASNEKRWGKKTPAEIIEEDCQRTSANVSERHPLTLPLSLSQKKENTIRRLGEPKLPELCQIWNLNRGKLPAVKGCEGKRLRDTQSAWRGKPEEAYWRALITKLLASEFCTGKNDTGWRATYDFLVRPGTATKIDEGLYDNKSASSYVGIAELLRQDEERKRELKSI